MAREGEEMPWTVGINRDLDEYLRETWQERREAPKRHQEMLRVHQAGWESVATAISRGLGEIAKAIRERR